MVKSVIYNVKYTEDVFQFYVWIYVLNYGSRVDGYVRSSNMAMHIYIYTKYSESLIANNSFKKCSFAPKVIPELFF